jgi:hypothetical protein
MATGTTLGPAPFERIPYRGLTRRPSPQTTLPAPLRAMLLFNLRSAHALVHQYRLDRRHSHTDCRYFDLL